MRTISPVAPNRFFERVLGLGIPAKNLECLLFGKIPDCPNFYGLGLAGNLPSRPSFQDADDIGLWHPGIVLITSFRNKWAPLMSGEP
ncbi:hypothetical protein GQ602_005198 [Ophiocordyceps camponoti-floridani]|uniref:Uncharacterized protein n=1 Tax=Ophiocordyceps camponoti-floridani TaxID=2030778 RepID=A0A8H4Q571_9HYPO|nr:hypothetical protein GQ602_005198 [Ophiocordyceps camponoti-floridani]